MGIEIEIYVYVRARKLEGSCCVNVKMRLSNVVSKIT